MIPEEEQRAAEYRAQLVRRAKNRIAQRKALAGDPAARLALAKNWLPVQLAQEERSNG